VDWTYWCVPTSFTMATRRYDNYIKGVGGILGYGRLAGWWQEHLELNNGPAHFTNVPDYIERNPP
jgi:hypothetical protein